MSDEEVVVEFVNGPNVITDKAGAEFIRTIAKQNRKEIERMKQLADNTLRNVENRFDVRKSADDGHYSVFDVVDDVEVFDMSWTDREDAEDFRRALIQGWHLGRQAFREEAVEAFKKTIG